MCRRSNFSCGISFFAGAAMARRTVMMVLCAAVALAQAAPPTAPPPSPIGPLKMQGDETTALLLSKNEETLQAAADESKDGWSVIKQNLRARLGTPKDAKAGDRMLV